MRYVSWNVNGLRAVVGKNFKETFESLDADIVCLQETKMQAGQLDLSFPGYESYWNYAEKKGYSGTAVFTRQTPLAVTYGIGHSAYETFASGVTCLGLIGTGQANPNILWIQIFSFIEGTAYCAAATVLIFYGIRTDRAKRILPIVILMHMMISAGTGLLADPAVVVLRTLLTAGMCFAAYRCWKEMADAPEDSV